ncbi:hypothetical protein MPSEU_000707100 [Mayamaea pseudoterrestris]|nr:hypothetical protein MPSEU_000707100 [Mayamaea pseudoterrestris]
MLDRSIALARFAPTLRGAKRKLASATCRTLSSQILPPIIALEEAVIGYPDAKTRSLGPFHLSIAHPSTGGHVLLGKNGSGKSLVAYTLASLALDDDESAYLRSGSFYTESNWHKRAVAKVSFQSHEELLARGGTVSKTISDGGNLSKAAKFLVVRFGLYHHLHRQVNTLSTGEIRKVLLIRALATRPRLLILDNAFDGLDIETRETLKDLVSRTIQGFRPDILVQAVSAKATAHTQVLLMTHRAEEIVNDIQHVTILNDDGSLKTKARNRSSGESLLNQAMGVDAEPISLPSISEIRSFWGKELESIPDTTAFIRVNGLQLEKGDAVLLRSLNWSVKRGERWLIAGRNGAGKSTLGRLLAMQDNFISNERFSVLSNKISCDNHRIGVGWCSTELHLQLTLENNGRTVHNVFEHAGSTSIDTSNTILAWLGFNDTSFSTRLFSSLSQGQQKLVLIGSAIASRPHILVLDEITQGLDSVHRKRVLCLLELICEATHVTLVYITHHLEEILPSITHILHLVRGEAVYNGPVQAYDASAAKSFEQSKDAI